MPTYWSEKAYAAIVELHARYAITLDRQDAAGLAECFAEHATLSVNGVVACRGSAEIAGRLTSRSDPAVIHLPFPPARAGEVDGRLITRSYFQLVDTRSGGLTGIGTYEDEMTHTHDGWVFASRSVSHSWKAEAR